MSQLIKSNTHFSGGYSTLSNNIAQNKQHNPSNKTSTNLEIKGSYGNVAKLNQVSSFNTTSPYSKYEFRNKEDTFFELVATSSISLNSRLIIGYCYKDGTEPIFYDSYDFVVVEGTIGSIRIIGNTISNIFAIRFINTDNTLCNVDISVFYR